jgi:hypothetical protein
MRTSTGVVISGIIAVLAGLNLFRFAVFLAFKFHPPSAWPPFVPTVTLAVGVLLVACAVWGVCTGIGLIWHKRWARISIQVFGVVLALLSLPAEFGVLMAQVPVVAKAPRSVLYLAQIAIAAWWLVLFNTRGAKEAFEVRDR